jgi:hypothetical protein
VPASLTIADFADLFGTNPDALPASCIDLIKKGNWAYEPYTQAERDQIIIDFLRRLRDRQFSFVTEGDKARWITGWGENLKGFKDSAGDVDALTPKYIRPNMPVRLHGDFVKTTDPFFEKHWYEVFREWLLLTYFQGFDHIFEFGCGSGFNVARLAELYPKATITGLDWAEPSVEIVESLRTLKGLKTKGRQFDFFNPDYSVEIPPNSAVLTVGALEQTGENNAAFLDFLLAKKPSLVVHAEPTYDWYDPDNLVDHLAIAAHELRNFWRGYHARLNKLKDEGKVEIIKTKRAYFGSLVLEGYSQTIWRPL